MANRYDVLVEREKRNTRLADGFVNMTSSIAFQLVVAFAVTEALQAVDWKDSEGKTHHLFGDTAGSSLEAVLAGGALMGAMAKSGVIDLLKEGTKTAGATLSQALPLVLAAGATL